MVSVQVFEGEDRWFESGWRNGCASSSFETGEEKTVKCDADLISL